MVLADFTTSNLTSTLTMTETTTTTSEEICKIIYFNGFLFSKIEAYSFFDIFFKLKAFFLLLKLSHQLRTF